MENRIRRGEEAKQLLENPLLVEAFSLLETAYTDEWKNSGLNDAQKREDAYWMLTSLGAFRRQLVAFVTDGSIAKSQVKKL